MPEILFASLSSQKNRKPGAEKDTVQEGLTPGKAIYRRADYSKDKPIEIRKTSNTVWLDVPETQFYPAPYPIELGLIAEPAVGLDPTMRYTEDAVKGAVDGLLKAEFRDTYLHLLRLSPYWISSLAERPDIISRRKGRFANILLLYRLVEICLAALQEFYKAEPKLAVKLHPTNSLLLRQRYLYLVQLETLAKAQKVDLSDYVPQYAPLTREAREAYAKLVLDEDKILVAFAEVENQDKPWDLDGEVRLLMYTFARLPGETNLKVSQDLWPFARENLPDLILTDSLLRRWCLANDDLAQASKGVHALFKQDKKISKSAICGFQNFHASNLIGLVIWFVGALIPEDLAGSKLYWVPQVIMCIGWFVGLILPLLSVIMIMISAKRPFAGQQVLYPLVLRVPAMGLVGVLAIAGLMDAMVKFTLNAFDQFWPSFLIAAGSLFAAFAYILFEVQTRVPVFLKAVKRACRLWFRGIISTLWLAVFTGWLVDPLGLTSCPSDADPLMCSSLTRYSNVIALHRAVNFLGERISLDYVIMIGALALLVGVFTQIFWEDKAIAEPL